MQNNIKNKKKKWTKPEIRMLSVKQTTLGITDPCQETSFSLGNCSLS